MTQPPISGNWLTFRVGSRLLALPFASVLQACPLAWVAPTVAAPAHVIGLLCCAGQTIAVIDTARRLQLPPRTARLDHALLLLAPQFGPQPSALWVDAVEGVLELRPSDLEAAAPYPAPMPPDPTADSAEILSRAADLPDLGLLSGSLIGQVRCGDEWCHLLDAEFFLNGPWRASVGDAWQFAFGDLPLDQRTLLQLRATQLAEVAAAEVVTAPWVTFRVAAEQFALPLMQLVEALACPSLYPLADPLPAARHLANYRGEPLLVAEFRRILGAEPQAVLQKGSLMVVADGDERLGLLVDEVLEVLQVDERAVSSAGALPWIRGVLQVQDATVGLVDLASLLSDPGLGTAK